MGVYQNMQIDVEEKDLSCCPRCGQKPVPQGVYLKTKVIVPVKVRILIFYITLRMSVQINYCPKCGFLRVNIS